MNLIKKSKKRNKTLIISERVLVAIIVGIFAYFLYQYGLLPWTMQNYGGLFVIMTSFSILLVSIQTYFNKIIDRTLLGYLLYGCVGSLAYLLSIPFLINFYDRYPMSLLLGSILVIGLLCTFFTPSGFFDKEFENKKLVKQLSLKVLTLWFILFLFSLYMEAKLKKIDILPLLFFGIPRILYDTYFDRLSGKKTRKWTFKW